MSATIIVNGKEYEAKPAITVNNWLDKESSDYVFLNQKRKGPVNEIVLHETVTRSHMDTVRVLKPVSPDNKGGRNLGVHFIVESDGTVYQHGDLLTDLLWHAGQHNGTSVGVEVVNPYQPEYLPTSKSPWTTVIDAPWAAGGRYVVPTLAQLEATACLVVFVCSQESWSPPGLEVPFKWIGLRDSSLYMGRVPGAEVRAPGIYAHSYFEHADGAFVVLYAFLRIACGIEKEEAYAEAIKLATWARKPIDLSSYIARNPVASKKLIVT